MESKAYPNLPPPYSDPNAPYQPPYPTSQTPYQPPYPVPQMESQQVIVPQPPPTQTTMVTQFVAAPTFGKQSARLQCHNCQAEVVTRTEKKAGIIPWVSGAVLAFFGCICGCCLIPCCVDDCLDVEHTCPNCNIYLGKNRAFM